MAFKYSHKDAVRVFPKGDYEAIIVAAVDGTSKTSGNPMLTVKFRVYSTTGGEMLLDEYIVTPGTVFKLGAIAKALGKSDEFKADTFDVERYIGKSLIVELDIEEGNGDYPEKNRIKKYKPLDRAASGKPVTTSSSAAHDPIVESDIPF